MRRRGVSLRFRPATKYLPTIFRPFRGSQNSAGSELFGNYWDGRTRCAPLRTLLFSVISFHTVCQLLPQPSSANGASDPPKMSVTTTQNPLTRTALTLLADYQIHHSGDDEHVAPPSNATNQNPLKLARSPNTAATYEEHDDDEKPQLGRLAHRRVPPYRPINRNLNPEERPTASNPAEVMFVVVMLNGVNLNAVSSVTITLTPP